MGFQLVTVFCPSCKYSGAHSLDDSDDSDYATCPECHCNFARIDDYISPEYWDEIECEEDYDDEEE